jgi:hypothetical protein
MKIFWIVLASLVLLVALYAGINYLIQRRRQTVAQQKGVVVYATVLSVEKVGGWVKQLDIKKIMLRVQEPGANTGREVTLRTRTAPGQKITAGMKLMVVIDPNKPEQVYPASPEAAKRVVLTGSRMERRQMKAKGL